MSTLSLSPRADEIDPRTVERARRGDRDAFGELVRHYDPALRALCYRLLGSREQMDDVLQEAYVRAFRGLPRYRRRAALGTWLYRIVYNACIDELRRSRRHAALPLDELAEPPDPQPEPIETVAWRQDLARALAGLPPEDRAAVLLVDAHGLDYRAAAEVLGVPAGTVASRLHRARARLRHALEEHEGEAER
jgi:RNA polymerase sigma-70 factor (ECF subfamily)